jgi:hypothetical protein
MLEYVRLDGYKTEKLKKQPNCSYLFTCPSLQKTLPPGIEAEFISSLVTFDREELLAPGCSIGY